MRMKRECERKSEDDLCGLGGLGGLGGLDQKRY